MAKAKTPTVEEPDAGKPNGYQQFEQFIDRLRADRSTPANAEVIKLLEYYAEAGKLCARALKLIAPTPTKTKNLKTRRM